MLVNNFGIEGMGPLLSHKVKKFYDLMAVNAVPQAIVSREFISRKLIHDKKLAIINLLSITATKPFGLTTYTRLQKYLTIICKEVVFMST